MSFDGGQDDCVEPSPHAPEPVVDIVGETERLLSVRRRDLVLGEPMLALYEKASWRQRSAIVRAWMKWVTILLFCVFFINLAYMPHLSTESFLICCIGLPALNAVAYWIWTKPRSPHLEGATIAVWCSLLMILISLLGAWAGGQNHERYATGALFVINIAVMVLGIRFSWTKTLATVSMGVFLASSLFDPLTTLAQAISLLCFYTLGVGATLVARRTAILLAHESFLMRLRDRYNQNALAETNGALRKLASTDPLTGLSNRRSAKIEIEAAWSDPSRRGRGFAMIMCDIDHFKMLNDRCGHAGGDDCLRRIAEAIRLAVDPQRDIVARFGGEEFLVCLSDVDLGVATETAERLRRSVEALAVPNPAAPGGIVTMSLGLAQAVADASSEMVTLWADEALYQAKRQGRNRVGVFAGNLALVAARQPLSEPRSDEASWMPIASAAASG